MVGLGVSCDSNLTFRDHIKEKINKAYSVVGIIKRNFLFIWMTKLFCYFIYQWYVFMSNLHTQYGMR